MLCFVLSTGGSGTCIPKHIWKHLNMQLRQQKGEMTSLQALEARITFLQIAIGSDISLKLTPP